jgi:hypothetical protein
VVEVFSGGQSSGEGGRGGGRQQPDAHWRPRRPMEVEVILEARPGGDTGGAGRGGR